MFLREPLTLKIMDPKKKENEMFFFPQNQEAIYFGKKKKFKTLIL